MFSWFRGSRSEDIQDRGNDTSPCICHELVSHDPSDNISESCSVVQLVEAQQWLMSILRSVD